VGEKKKKRGLVKIERKIKLPTGQQKRKRNALSFDLGAVPLGRGEGGRRF